MTTPFIERKLEGNRKTTISEREYANIHHWLRTTYGKANKCESTDCPGISSTFQWALLHEFDYAKDRSNFWMLCKSCHTKYDFTEETRRLIAIGSSGPRNNPSISCVCGNLIERPANNQKFCSDSCRHERSLQQAKKWREANKEKLAQNYTTNREYYRARFKQNYLKRKEQLLKESVGV